MALYIFVIYREEYLAKIKRRVEMYKVEEVNPPREDKRLLVLDIDYTIFGIINFSFLSHFCIIFIYSVIKPYCRYR